MTTTCYCCDEPATSIEHVPPQCMFPKASEDPNGVGYRAGLIEVPSCERHNNAKSADDEFLLVVIAMADGANHVGQLLIPRVLRARRRRPTLLEHLMRPSRPVTIVDRDTGQQVETGTMHPTFDRTQRALGQVGLGLYFHHYRERWAGFPTAVCRQFKWLGRDARNREWEAMCDEFDRGFDGTPPYGKCPDAFYFQVAEGPSMRVIRATFYRGISVYYSFDSDPDADG